MLSRGTEMHEVALAAFFGSLISLDRTAFLQMMISQPLVSGTLVGFSLGEPFTGLAIGSVLELLWAGSIPVGSSIPPNETAAAVIATSVSIIAGKEMGAPSIHMMVFSMILSIPLAVLGQGIDVGVRRYNKRFAAKADRLLESGDIRGMERENLKGLLTFFTASFLSLILLIFIGLMVARVLYPLIPPKGFPMAFYLLLSLGVAVSVRMAKGGRIWPLAAGFLAGLTLFSLRG